MKAIRVLHVIGTAERGGTQTSLVNLLKYLPRDLVAFDFLVYRRVHGGYEETMESLGSKVLVVGRPRPILAFVARLRQVLRESGPYDVVHSHVEYFSGPVLALARMLGVRALIAHSHAHRLEADRRPSLSRKVYTTVAKRLVDRLAVAGIASSCLAAETLYGTEWRKDPRWRVWCPTPDFTAFVPAADRSKFRADLDMRPDSLVFGHVGRFVPEKNHRFLVEVASALLLREPKALFCLVGEGPTKERIQAKLQDMGIVDRFRVLSARDDVPQLMLGAFDAFLFPSLSEGLGLALIEAQGAGLQCFVSEGIPLEAIVIPDLVSRLPLEIGPAGWADYILNRLKQPMEVSRGEALGVVKSMFDVREVGRKWVRMYRDAVEQERR